MKKMICLLMICLLLAVMPMGAFANADVRAMIDELPTVEQFQALDPDAQLEAYHRTQAAYDAYMALSEGERAEIAGGEAVFETLFCHFNSQIMTIDAAAEQQVPAAENTGMPELLTAGLALAVSVVTLRILNRKQ